MSRIFITGTADGLGQMRKPVSTVHEVNLQDELIDACANFGRGVSGQGYFGVF
jgi:hypothetical protein